MDNQSASGIHITADSLFSMRSFDCEKDLPIVYKEDYNISLFGVELFRSFDTKKYKKISDQLNLVFLDTTFARHADLQNAKDTTIRPQRQLHYLKPCRPVSLAELKIHHSDKYVEIVHREKFVLSKILDSYLLFLVPRAVIERRVMRPIKSQIAGSIFAAHLAIQHGWAINIGGGFHQSAYDRGSMLCVFSDVMLLIRYIWRKHPFQKFMIIDLDSHQATGIERDVAILDGKRRKFVYVFDMYNSYITPPDSLADNGVDLRVELDPYTFGDKYLEKLKQGLEIAFQQFKPTLVIYIAGQDVLHNDQCGKLNLTDEELVNRDEMVFNKVVDDRKCPILMLLGGGFTAHGVDAHVRSIRNLFAKGLIWGGVRSGERSLSRPKAYKSTN